MKDRPFTHQLGEAFAFKCPTNCPYFGSRGKGNFYDYDSCLTGITIGQLKCFLQGVLGERESEASSSSDHTRRLESFLWDHCTKEKGFCFLIEGRVVCENTAAFLLGYLTGEGDIASVGGGWKKAKQKIKSGKTSGYDFAQLCSEDLRLPTSASGNFVFVILHTQIYILVLL